MQAISVEMDDGVRSQQAGERIRGQIRHSLVLLLGRFIALALNLAVQVITVRYLAKADYGALAFALSMLSFGANVSLLGLDKTLARFVAIHDEREDIAELKGVLQFCITGVLATGLLAVIGVVGYLQLTTVSPSPSTALLLLAVALIPLQAIDNALLSLSAAFQATGAIFVRRHVLTPGLKLIAVVVTVASAGSVRTLALCHVVAAAVGLLLFVGVIGHYLHRKELWTRLKAVKAKRPVGELLKFAAPNFLSDLVTLLRLPLIVIFLEAIHGSLAVADFRAVVPFARLNDIVLQSFVFLFIPTMSRLFAKGDRSAVSEMHWQSILWVTVFAFPMFVVTFSLGEPLATFVFGARYAGSGSVLSVLAVAYFIQALSGLHSRALRVHNKTRYIIAADIVATAVIVLGNFVLVRQFEALGGAMCLLITVAVHALTHKFMLHRAIGISPFDRRYLGLYFSTAALACVVWACHAWQQSFLVTFGACVVSSIALLRLHCRAMAVEETLPQLAKLPIVRLLVGTKRPQRRNHD